MSFKAPKYRKFLDPWKVNVYAYPYPVRMPPISDADFRMALEEAHWLMSLAIDQETAARMRRQSRRGVAGVTSRAEIKARELAVSRRDEILWLMAGMMELHLPMDNAAARKRAEELCKQAKERRQEAKRKARLKQGGQTGKIGFPVAYGRINAAKRKR